MDKDKKKKIIMISCIVVVIIGIVTLGILFFKKTNSLAYQLKKVGYSEEEVKILIDKNIAIDTAKKEYHESLTKFITSKYFMLNRLNRYLEYYKNNKDKEISRIVSIVNANMDKEMYSDIKEVYQKDNLVIVNRFYKLESSAVPDDLEDISVQYAYDGHQLKNEANTAYIKMARSAKENNISLIANVSYRSYEEQEKTYNSYKSRYGELKADEIAARPSHSEHQTGLAINISTRLKEGEEKFEDTDAYKWLIENAYKYGFILRYPEGKEDITGFSFEPGHYRYVGVEVAKKIKEEDITFDEYYAFYLENNIK